MVFVNVEAKRMLLNDQFLLQEEEFDTSSRRQDKKNHNAGGV